MYDFYDSGYGRSGLINLQTTRKPFGTECRYEYVALYCNDQIERIMLEIEHEVQTSVYYKHNIKKLFKQMKLEVRSYSILRRQHTQVSESEFANLMIEMEDKYKKHIDILVFSISNSLLKDNVTGDNNKILSSLLARVCLRRWDIVHVTFSSKLYRAGTEYSTLVTLWIICIWTSLTTI